MWALSWTFDGIKCSVILNELILFVPVFALSQYFNCIQKETSQCDWYERLIKFFLFPFYQFILCHRLKYASRLPVWRIRPTLYHFLTEIHENGFDKDRGSFVCFLVCFFIILVQLNSEHDEQNVKQQRKK